MKLTGAAILVSRGMKVLQAAPAAYPFRSAWELSLKYLSRSFALAEARGYLRYPEVVALEEIVPEWFRRLATTEGANAFETRHGATLPAAIREYYACTGLACFL